jgi:hypothetical protein
MCSLMPMLYCKFLLPTVACVYCPQARDPRQTGEVDPSASYGITATMEHQEQAEHGHHRRHMMFCAGQAVERDTGEEHAVRSDADGYSWKDATSIDAMLFPMLHPGGMGAFKRGESLSAMLQQRMQQLFSGFTLLPEYVLVMFQVSNLCQQPSTPPPGAAQGCMRLCQHGVPPMLHGSCAVAECSALHMIRMLRSGVAPGVSVSKTCLSPPPTSGCTQPRGCTKMHQAVPAWHASNVAWHSDASPTTGAMAVCRSRLWPPW